MRIIRKRLLGLLCILSLGAAAVIGLTSCGGGGSGVVYKVNFYRDTKTLWQTMEIDADKDLTLPEDPERDGFVFIGWYTDKEYTNAFDKDAPIKGNVTLYAAWKALPAAPTNLKWNKTTETLSWEAKTGENVSYILTYTKDGQEKTETLDKLSYTFTEVGNYQASVVVKEGEDSSKPSSILSFSIVAPKYTVKFKDGEADYATAEVLNQAVTLPAAPTKVDAHFKGWYTDTTFDTVFDETRANTFFDSTIRKDQTISVFAKWEYKPVAPAKVERITYNDAKLGQEQKLYWQASTDANFDYYGIKITTMDGTSVETATNLKTPQFVLNNAKYTAGVTYYAEIRVISKLTWEEQQIQSETATKEFKFNIVPEDRFTVTFKVDGVKYSSDNVQDGETATLPPVVPTKPNFVFVKWVLADNTEFKATTVVTADVDVHAYFAAKPVAPTTVTYTDSECSISWTAVATASKYFYQINNGLWQETSGTKLTVYGLSKGQNSIKFKVLAPVTGVTGEVESEISVVNFTVTDLYVALVNQGTITFVKVDDDGKIAKPADPIKQDYQFIKWTVDNNLESGAINFETRTYTKTTMIYAMFYVRPAQVVSGSLVYTQDTDEITWDPVTGVDSYKVKWNGATKYITVTTPKIKANVSLTGDYDIEIIAVKNVPGIGYIESYAYSTQNFTINLSSETVYSPDGTQIKIVNAQGEATYIYFAGQTYYISGTEGYAVFADSSHYTKLLDHSRNAIKMNNVVTPTNAPFDLTFTVDGATHSRKALIVPQISTFTAGDVYHNAKTPSAATFIDTTQPYCIGVADTSSLTEGDYKQYYYLDLDLNYFAGDYQDALVEFNFKFYIDGEDVTNTIASTYGITLKKDNGKYALSFGGKTSNYIGKTLRVSITPRYLNKAQYDEQTASQAWTRTFDFVLSKGVNVYTHENLKAAMADKACLGISIHSNIVAELAANQINDNGGAVNFEADTRTSYTYTNGQNSNRTVVAGDVYRRDFVGATNKTLTVNGNYCTIDASAINKVKASTAYDAQWGYAGTGEGYNIPSVHVGIFRVVGEASHSTTNHEQGTFNISNLEIRGNTEIRGSNKAEFEEYAGGYGGIHVNDVALNADNVNVHHSNIAFFVYSNNNWNNYSLLKSIKTDQNWSNSLYSYGTACVKILSSNIGLSSGAALHMEDVASNLYAGAANEVRHDTPHYDLLTDKEKASEIRLDPCLILGTNTVINNGMFGDEPYLTAYGLAAYVAQIKSDLQTAINTNFNALILKQKPSSAETYFNFAFMFRPYAPCAQLELGIYDENQNQLVNTWCYRSKAAGDDPSGSGTYVDYNGATKQTSALSVASGVGYAGSQLLVPINQYLNANTKSRELFAAYTQWYAYYAGFLALNPGQTENAVAYADSQVPAYNALKTLYEGDLDAAMKETAQGIVTATGGDATQMQQAIMATLFNGRTDRNDPATEYGSSTKIGGKSYYTIYLDGAAFGGGTDSNAVCIFEYGFGTGWYY